jgi:hypothetical protein
MEVSIFNERFPSTRLHGVILRKTVNFRFTAVRTSDLLSCCMKIVSLTRSLKQDPAEREIDRQTDSERSSSAHERRRESRTRGPDCQTDRYIQLSWRVPQVTVFTVLSQFSWHKTTFITNTNRPNAILSITHVTVQIYKNFWKELFVYISWYDTDLTGNSASNKSCIVASLFLAAVTFLPSWFLVSETLELPNDTEQVKNNKKKDNL